MQGQADAEGREEDQVGADRGGPGKWSCARRSTPIIGVVRGGLDPRRARVYELAIARFRGNDVTAITKLLGAAAAAAVLLVGASTFAQDAKKPAATASPCKGLEEAACKAKSECQWIVPKKGKQKPYCKLKAVPKKKVTQPAKKEPAK